MAQYNTVFNTLTKILPRHEIDCLDRKYGQGDKHARRAGRRSKNVVDDETIKLNGCQTPFRLIHYISPEDQHEYHFITNAMHLPAQTIADIYKERWRIELFF